MPPKKRGQKKGSTAAGGGGDGRKKKKALTPAEKFAEKMENCPQIIMPTYLPPGQYPIWEAMSDEEDEDEDEEGDEEDDDDMEPSLELEYKEGDELPSLASLVGTYDLIFYYSLHSEPDWKYNRATKGTLTLEKHQGKDVNDDPLSLKGLVVVDDSVKKDLEPHYVDWEFKVTKKTINNDRFDLDITNPAEDFWVPWQEIALQDAKESEEGNGCIPGTIKVLRSRHALRFMPEKQALENGSISPDRLKLEIKYAKSIKFENDQEAEKILAECEKGQRYQSLEKKMNLPEQELKPPPVLFLEENDLHLMFDWNSEETGGLETHFIARRA